MAEQTKTAVQLHKKGNVNELIFAQTKGELVELANGQTLEAKIPSLENVIEVVKIGNSALVVGENKTITIPDFYAKDAADTKFATKDEVSAIPKFGIEVVEELPTTGAADKVYLVVTGEESENIYTEYIYVNNVWEKLGAQKVDISGKQDALTEAQLNAVNSGITADKVSAYDAYATGKQDKLSDAQLNAANSGITAAKVSTYDGYAAGKQDKLTEAQLNAANSGITSAKVSTYDGYAATIANKAESSTVQTLSETVEGLDYLEYTVIKTL